VLLDVLSGAFGSWATLGSLDGFFSSVKQLVEVADLEKPVVVHRMPVLREFPGAAPVAESIAVDTKILGRFGDPHVFIQLGHRTPPQRARWVGRYYDAITLTNWDTNEKHLLRHANRDLAGVCGRGKVDRHVRGLLHGNGRRA